MRVPKKRPKKLSKNRFWDAFWPPKPTQNRRKIDSKSMLTKDSKNKQKKHQRDPLGKPVLTRNGKSEKLF